MLSMYYVTEKPNRIEWNVERQPTLALAMLHTLLPQNPSHITNSTGNINCNHTDKILQIAVFTYHIVIIYLS